MITLHHALKDLANADISEIKFNSVYDLKLYIDNMVNRIMVKHGDYKPSSTIYLFTYNMPDGSESEVFITAKIYLISDLLSKAVFFGFDLVPVFFLQEFNSYEEAYKVALSMKEISPLCYEQKNKPNINPNHDTI